MDSGLELVPRPPVASPARQSFTVTTAALPPPEGASIALPMLHAPHSTAAASFRWLRHRLAERGGPSVIAVSSAGVGEGKTTLAANLALAMAEHGERVLLVEANRSRPRLAEAFGVEVSICVRVQLSTCINLEAPEWWVAAAPLDALHLLAADPRTSEDVVVTPQAYRVLFDAAKRAGYRQIVLDCGQVGDGGDLSLFADRVDGVLLAAHAGVTRAGALRDAVEQLAPARILGTVLTR